MAIIKKHGQHWYSVPTKAARDKTLSLQAFGLLCWLLSHADNFSVTLEQIPKHFTNGQTSVRSAMQELRQAGYVVYKGREVNVDGTFGKSVWEIHAEKPALENPSLEDVSVLDISKGDISNKEIKDNARDGLFWEDVTFQVESVLHQLGVNYQEGRGAIVSEWLQYQMVNAGDVNPFTTKKLIERVGKWSEDRLKSAVDYSIAQGYKGLIEPKTSKGGAKGQLSKVRDEEQEIAEYYSKRTK